MVAREFAGINRSSWGSDAGCDAGHEYNMLGLRRTGKEMPRVQSRSGVRSLHKRERMDSAGPGQQQQGSLATGGLVDGRRDLGD
jgi:hypothetical protein